MAVTARGLTPADIDSIRDHLTSGRKPKVVFTASAGQVAGTVGQVIQLTDPARSDEWIVVRFGRDELPFSPADLATPGSPNAPKVVKAAAARRNGAAPAGPPLAPPITPAQPRPAPPAAKAAPAPAPAPAQSLNGAEPAPRPAKAAKVKPPASLTVTLAYAEREWTVAASMGSRTLAKPYVIKPTDALRMVALIDVPGVHEAVESIIEAERVEAETRASRLRAELADIESRLAELTSRA
jgi:hypothetical protein